MLLGRPIPASKLLETDRAILRAIGVPVLLEYAGSRALENGRS
jgi:hypothetical protein